MEKSEDRLFALGVMTRRENDDLNQPYPRLISDVLED